MNQSERRRMLIQSLLKEDPAYRDIRIPADTDGQRHGHELPAIGMADDDAPDGGVLPELLDRVGELIAGDLEVVVGISIELVLCHVSTLSAACAQPNLCGRI